MAAGGKDRQSANLQWLRCLRCCDSAKDDRQMVLLSCSHILCASCISAIQSKEAGKLICPICKKSVKSIPVNSSKMPENIRAMFRPCSLDERIKTFQFRQQHHDQGAAKMMDDINKMKQVYANDSSELVKVQTETGRLAAESANIRGQLFKGFSDAEFKAIMAMPDQQMKAAAVGRMVFERHHGSSAKSASSNNSDWRHK